MYLIKISCALILGGDFSMLTLFAEDIHNNLIELLKDNLYESNLDQILCFKYMTSLMLL